jgi:hypothetical protein
MMTDPDNPPKGFLERWSRNKIESEREASDPPAEPRAAPVEPAPIPEFDLASLPSLESITAATDIRAFLESGVPRALARAALRRAWSADPAIRDFKGLAENDWDFTDPAAMPGFGALPPGTDVKKMLAQIFGDEEKPAAAAASQLAGPPEAHKANEIAAPMTQAEAAPAAASEDDPTTPKFSVGGQQGEESGFLHRSNNTAAHNSSSDDETEERKNRRQHGSALPQ